MKFFKILFALLALIPSLSFAQKLDIDRKKVKVAFLRLPNNVVDPALKTYQVSLDGGYNISNWGLDPQAVQDEYLKMEGYEKVDANGDLKLQVKVSPIRFIDSGVKSRKIENKDSKTGKVTTTYKYWYEISYERGFSGKLLDKTDKQLWKYQDNLPNLALTSIETYKSDEYDTYRAASDALSNDYEIKKRNIASNLIRNSLAEMKRDVNQAFGFLPDSETFQIFVTDSDKHPENTNFRGAGETCKGLFESLTPTETPAEIQQELAKIMDYYKTTSEKYNSTEKADAKLRYACYYNLAQITYYLDRPDETIAWCKKLEENGHEKSDAKGIVKDAEKLKALLLKHKMTTRRFQRVAKA